MNSNLELSLLACPALKRLHDVAQLGFAYQIPHISSQLSRESSNTHVQSRLEHTMETLAAAKQALRLFKCNSPDIRRHVIAATLLQDIGHSPFSMSLDHAFGIISEVDELEYPPDIARTLTIIYHDSCIRAVLEQHRIEVSVLAQLIRGVNPWPRHRFISMIFDSPLDADRFAYVTGDALFAGLKVADISRLQESLQPAENQSAIIAAHAIEQAAQFVLARAQLYMSTYYHHLNLATAFIVSRILTSVWEFGLKCAPLGIYRRPKSVPEFLNWTDTRVANMVSELVAGTDAQYGDARRLSRQLRDGKYRAANIRSVRSPQADFKSIRRALCHLPKRDDDTECWFLNTANEYRFTIYEPESIIIKESTTHIPLDRHLLHFNLPSVSEPYSRLPIVVFRVDCYQDVERDLRSCGLALDAVDQIDDPFRIYPAPKPPILS